MIRVGVVGGSGYTGGELIRLILQHPSMELDFVYSRSKEGEKISTCHADLLGQTKIRFTKKINKNIDVVYLCLGHGNSLEFLKNNNFSKKTLIVDLGNDFRLKRDSSFNGRNFVYGLPELQREKIKSSDSIANPGCFATAIQLSILPLAQNNTLKNTLHINATTGSTGAGISLNPTSHFSWRNNNFSWYKPFEHQHINEIYQSVNQLGSNPKINFLPNRGNFTRGIFSTCYTEYNGSLNDVKKIYKSFYREHPFTLISENEISLKSVINSNYCFLHLYKHENILLITSILDNLIKGAAGQAIQNTNIIMGWEEDAGLQLKASTF